MRWPNLRRIRAVFRVETAQLISDRPSLSLILLLPIVQILLYGYAINLNPTHIPLAVATDDGRLAGRMTELVDRSPWVARVGAVGAPGSAESAVRQGRALIGLEIGQSEALGAPEARIFADASDPTTVRPAVAAIESMLWRQAIALYVPENAPGLRVIWLHNDGADTRRSVTPGLIGVVIMISMLFLGALTLARERERGSWESLLATPVTPADALIGKLSPYLVIGVAETALLLGAVHLLFDVPLPPAAVTLLLAAPLLATAYLILGFAFSAMAQTQMQAIQGAVAIYLPSLLLSGFIFPFRGMPVWAQWIGEAMPLTHFIRATRAVLLRGEGPETVVRNMVPVVVFAVAAFVIAVLAYRRRLD